MDRRFKGTLVVVVVLTLASSCGGKSTHHVAASSASTTVTSSTEPGVGPGLPPLPSTAATTTTAKPSTGATTTAKPSTAATTTTAKPSTGATTTAKPATATTTTVRPASCTASVTNAAPSKHNDSETVKASAPTITGAGAPVKIVVNYHKGPTSYATTTSSGGQVSFTFTVSADPPPGGTVPVNVTIGSGGQAATCSTQFTDNV
jgi:hypothetical protein